MTNAIEQIDSKVIVFQLAGKEYAIPVEVVKSIERPLPITRVPNTPEYIKGVSNLRGVITPILDMRRRFQLESKQDDPQTRMIIVSMEGNDLGIVVDAANDVLDIPKKSIEPQPEVVGAIESDFIEGVVNHHGRLIVLLNLNEIIKPIDQGKAI